jgi:hypothetical protein
MPDQPAIVQINFVYALTEEELRESAAELVDTMNRQDGLLWKIWLIDDASKTTGGIYCFASRAQADAYANGAVVRHLQEQPPFADMTVRVFDVMQPHSDRTRAPVAGQ